MRSIRRILVAVTKPSTRILPAVDKAVQLAQALGAEVELFHAIATPIYTGVTTLGLREGAHFDHVQRRRLKGRLEAIATPIRKEGVIVTTHVGWDFPAGEAIVRRAVRIKGDLIVAECHPGKYRGALFLRLTDWELVRFSPVPLLLVKSKRPYRNPVVLAAVDPTHAYAKPAKLDDEILRCASSVQQALRGTLHAVHAFAPVQRDTKRSGRRSPENDEIRKVRARKDARARLQPLLKKVAVAPARQHLVARRPIKAILEVARATSSAIVVMGAVSRSGLKRVFIGNTAERILDAIPCDVLVVKPPHFARRLASSRRGAGFMTR